MLTTVLHGFWIKRTWVYASPLLSFVTNSCLFRQHFKYLKITMFLKMSFLSYDSHRCVSCKWMHIAPIYIQSFLQCVSSKQKSTKMAGTSMSGFIISVTTVEGKTYYKISSLFRFELFLKDISPASWPCDFYCKIPYTSFCIKFFHVF